MPRSTIPLLILLLTLAACAPRQGGSAIAEHAGSDLTVLDPEARRKATTRLAQALGRDLPAADDQRSGPRWIATREEGYLSCWLEAGETEALVVQGLGSQGRSRWTTSIALPAGARFAATELHEVGGLELLDVQLQTGKLAVPARLLLAVEDQGLVLVRAEHRDGGLANRAALTVLPELPLRRGDLGSQDRIEVLAATAWLSGPDRAADRGKPAVRSHLEKLAASNDSWLAQAAAELLTLPAG